MAAVAIIGSGRVLRIEARCTNQPNKSKSYRCIAVTFTLATVLNSCTQAARWKASVIKVVMACVGVLQLKFLKEKLT